MPKMDTTAWIVGRNISRRLRTINIGDCKFSRAYAYEAKSAAILMFRIIFQAHRRKSPPLQNMQHSISKAKQTEKTLSKT